MSRRERMRLRVAWRILNWVWFRLLWDAPPEPGLNLHLCQVSLSELLQGQRNTTARPYLESKIAALQDGAEAKAAAKSSTESNPP